MMFDFNPSEMPQRGGMSPRRFFGGGMMEGPGRPGMGGPAIGPAPPQLGGDAGMAGPAPTPAPTNYAARLRQTLLNGMGARSIGSGQATQHGAAYGGGTGRI